jgi:hypothetical protein
MESYRIAEIAQQTGLNKSTVYKYLDHFHAVLMDSIRIDNGVKYIDEKGLEIFHQIQSMKAHRNMELDDILKQLLDMSGNNGRNVDNSDETDIKTELAVAKKQIEMLETENGFLKERLSEAVESRQRNDAIIQQIQQDASESQQRSDTIILQFTRQFEEQTKLLEDMRQKEEPKNIGFFKRLLRKT